MNYSCGSPLLAFYCWWCIIFEVLGFIWIYSWRFMTEFETSCWLWPSCNMLWLKLSLKSWINEGIFRLFLKYEFWERPVVCLVLAVDICWFELSKGFSFLCTLDPPSGDIVENLLFPISCSDFFFLLTLIGFIIFFCFAGFSVRLIFASLISELWVFMTSVSTYLLSKNWLLKVKFISGADALVWGAICLFCFAINFYFSRNLLTWTTWFLLFELMDVGCSVLSKFEILLNRPCLCLLVKDSESWESTWYNSLPSR